MSYYFLSDNFAKQSNFEHEKKICLFSEKIAPKLCSNTTSLQSLHFIFPVSKSLSNPQFLRRVFISCLWTASKSFFGIINIVLLLFIFHNYFINSPTETPIAFANFVIVARVGFVLPASILLIK